MGFGRDFSGSKTTSVTFCMTLIWEEKIIRRHGSYELHCYSDVELITLDSLIGGGHWIHEGCRGYGRRRGSITNNSCREHLVFEVGLLVRLFLTEFNQPKNYLYLLEITLSRFRLNNGLGLLA